jgi:hypothetical protein
VHVISSGNAWAVGSFFNGAASQTLIVHWNGRSWRRVPSPNPAGAGNDNELVAVSGTSAASSWAVGDYFDGSARQTLVEHWNGTRWSRVKSPNPGGSAQFNFLNGVVAISSSDVWAVGLHGTDPNTQTLVLSWNGSSWVRVPSPDPAAGNEFSAVAGTSAANVWMVGDTSNGGIFQTLAIHCC